MATPTSGAILFSQVRDELGQSNPAEMSNFYDTANTGGSNGLMYHNLNMYHVKTKEGAEAPSDTALMLGLRRCAGRTVHAQWVREAERVTLTSLVTDVAGIKVSIH